MNQEEQALFLTLYYLDDTSLLKACQVNKKFYQQVCKNIWLGRIKDKFGLDANDVERNRGNKSYAEYYFDLSTKSISTVTKVEWMRSVSGTIHPTVHFKPIVVVGIYGRNTISRVSGFSAEYIVNNRIGPGAVITITLLGGIIPSLTEVLKSAGSPQMPDMEYVWDDLDLHIRPNKK